MTDEIDNPTLRFTIQQQDGGEPVQMRCADTVHNRLFVDYVERHEPFSPRACTPPQSMI